MYLTPNAALSLTDGYAPKVKRRISEGKVQILLDRMEKPSSRNKCRTIYMRVSLRNSESSHLFHACAIRIYGSKKDPKQYMMRPDSKMWLHCHCPFFFFYCEQALVMIKASSFYGLQQIEKGGGEVKCDPGKRGHGKTGVLRNPNLDTYICKHLYAAILALMRMEAGRNVYKPFSNKKNPYDGDYENKMPPSYSR